MPVVLLHAFPLSSGMWTPLRSAPPAGRTLITPELAPPPGREPSLDVLADRVAQEMDDAGIDRAVVGGLSMGGYVAMAFARRHRARLAGVVLADTKAGADPSAARANRLRIAETLEAEGNSRILLEESVPALTGVTTKRDRPEVVESVNRLAAATKPDDAAWWQRAMAARPDSFDTLRGLAVPALVIVGEEDTLSPPSDARAMVDALPNARLVVLPGAGHVSALETPAPFAAALAAFVEELG